MIDLLKAYEHASNHFDEIEASLQCGCFSCLQMFAPSEIIAWTGWDAADFSDLDSVQGTTALCPHCGNESVLGDKSGLPIGIDFLTQMNQAWVRKTIARRSPRA